VITHGQPRLGNAEFLKYFQKVFFNGNPSGDAFRVVTFADIVPHVPPMGLGFYHHLQEIWIDREVQEPHDYSSETYFCAENNYEDTRCSNAFLPHELRLEDHSYAWNITFGVCY
jgi:hypothetical protein